MSVDTPNAAIYGYQAMLGLGAGWFVHAGFASVQANLASKDSTHGLTLMTLGQLSGLAFGLSTTGAIFINIAKNNLAAAFPDLDQKTLVSVVSGTSGNFMSTLGQQGRRRALDAIVNALGKVFIQVYAVAALAFVLSLFLKVGGNC